MVQSLPTMQFIRKAVWSFAGLALLIPAVAMQFTKEVNWGLGDFLVAGALLLSLAFGFEYITRHITNKKFQLAACAAAMIAFLLIWAHLAVGIF